MNLIRNGLWRLLKAIAFRLDAEFVHLVALRTLRLLNGPALRIVSGADNPDKPADKPAVNVWGLEFLSPVGLAAGFDKDAEIVSGLPYLGFGFAEIGTITPRPQPGNDRPRLFRDPAREALFNRMGFNGLGAEVASRRLAVARKSLPPQFRVGVNIGKNKSTPAEDAFKDYILAASPFEGVVDYVVINVSSPNTPGLRALQSEEALKPIVEGVLNAVSGWKKAPPVLLKLAPEVSGDALKGILSAGPHWGVSGWVLTNTMAGDFQHSGRSLTGGWSGGPLTSLARARLVEARHLTRLPIVSVGGILSTAEALERLALGANLIQIYSGWIYRGPGFASAITKEWLKISKKNS